MTDSPIRRASLEVLRAEAADERAVLVQERLHGGEDPWEFMEELPTVDELVVLLLRAEDLGSQRRPDPEENFRVLRRIALDFPPLTPVVWRFLGHRTSHRRWDAAVRGNAS